MSLFNMKYIFHICMLFALTFMLTDLTVAQERSAEELEDLYWTRIQESKMNFTQADVDFMTGMIGHHAQALVMSDLAPENGASPTIQTLAARIINAQKDEIATMQTWLKERNQPVPIVNIDGLNLTITMEQPDSDDMHHDQHDTGEDDHQKMDHGEMDHSDMGTHNHHDMPGMLTQAQLEELAAARGAEFDRKFLSFMIQHHEGAVIMVTDLFDSDGAALDEQAFRLASDIQVDQITEIERMKLMLSQMSDAP
ncbi:DUF305 domain-containing protein [Rhodohalobacter mucosus]|uniref:DUF305 domain-containing protein n=1 Tax=Rhodohalobacter mucosus TaxID=2079485 RepID=A0A316TUN1_9BACT|nr:DUF305 domain-containing protein [Rhodohalobacter mucosus]PWN06775.1 DUF305 domain-containing protein [Rhodohalobacter mucosus]